MIGIEKPYNLLSANWRHRINCDIIQSEFQDLETEGAHDVNPSLRTGGDEISQLDTESGKKETNSNFLCFLIYSSPQQTGLCRLILERAIYLIETIDSNTNLIQKHVYRHNQKLSLTRQLAIPDPVKQTHKSSYNIVSFYSHSGECDVVNHCGFELSRPKYYWVLFMC